MKLWVDDVREPPEGYHWCKCVNTAKDVIFAAERQVDYFKNHDAVIELIDVDHDAGDYAQFGGDFIKLLDWLEETGRNYPIRIHTMNPVGRQNMIAICKRNGWHYE